MNSKIEVTRLFKVFYFLVENQFQAKISMLQSDNGKKSFNKCLGDFFFNGIVHQSTIRIFLNKIELQNGLSYVEWLF